MNDEAYSREELEKLSSDARPTKGEVCLKCGSHIPHFKDISKEDEERLRKLDETNPLLAMQELRRLIRCPLKFAKIWALHPNGPNHKEDRSAPCPFCGQPLRTSEAKQCRYCRRDWHDSENIISLPG